MDLSCRPGDDLSFRVAFTDAATGAFTDLSAMTAAATIAGVAASVSSTSTGVLTISLTDTQTTTIGAVESTWSLSLTASGTTTTFLAGNYTGSTRPRARSSGAVVVVAARPSTAVVHALVGPGGGSGGSGAPTDATYVVLSANGSLSQEAVLGTSVIMSGGIGSRPFAGTAGRVYLATDVAGGTLYVDNGSSWLEAAAAAAALSTHEADSTSVHGIADTSTLVTTSTALGGVLGGTVSAATFASDMATQAELDGHAAATSGVHGITAFGASLVDDADAATARATLGLVIGTNVQAQDAELAAIAGLTSAADRAPYFTGAGTAALATFTAAGRALVDDADASAQRATLGVDAAGTAASLVASHEADTTSVHGIADTSVLVTTSTALGGVLGGTVGAATFAADMATQAELDTHTSSTTTHGISTFGASLVDDADASAARTTLGLAAVASSGSASDLNTGALPNARLDTELQALAGLTSAADSLPYFTGAGTAALATFTAAGRALVDDADAAAQRTTLGLGSIATQAASSVSISGGSITGITDLAVADGGTGASTAAAARTNLEAAQGTELLNNRFVAGAGNATLTGNNNVAVGVSALLSATTATDCTAIGKDALRTATTVLNSAAIGTAALYAATTGNSNMAIGPFSLFGLTTGSNNVAIAAFAAGNVTTASHGTFIGAGANLATTTQRDYVTVVGRSATADGTNALALGRAASAGAAGAVAIGTSAAGTGASTSTADDIALGVAAHRVTIAGTLNLAGTTATTVGAAGGASALPATPTGYVVVKIGGTDHKIPYYAT